MTPDRIDYKRLPGRKPRFIGYDTLYLGPDHLLSVHGRGVVEEYKRFYYQDIQAILARRTWSGLIQIVVFILLAGLFSLPFIFTPEEEMAVWLVPAGIFLFIALILLLRGPTCVCHIRTAVQTEKLASLERLRIFRRFLDQVRPLIESLQGRVTPEMMSGYDRTPSVPASEAAAPPTPTPPPPWT
ncbi:MAG: hypothetical protein AB1641_28635 [Thermodesulfobacteriota bacterium]